MRQWPWRVSVAVVLLLLLAFAGMRAAAAPDGPTAVVGVAWVSVTAVWLVASVTYMVVVAVAPRFTSPRRPDDPEADDHGPESPD